MKKYRSFFEIGFLLVLFLWGIVFISTVFYLLGIVTTGTTLLVVFIGCTIVAKKFLDKDKNFHDNITDLILFTGILLVSVLASGAVFDQSWDGNNYQKAIVGLLQYGWNPIYLTYDEAANLSGLFSITEWSTWFDAYPKASSIIAAVFYAATNNIETGKVYTLLSCVAGIFIVYAYLNNYKKESNHVLNLFISMALFINPVSVSQCVTFYNDAFLWNLLFITFFACLHLTLDIERQYEKQSWVLIFLCIGLGFNIKFSALIYFALICGSFYFYWLYRIFKHRLNNKREIIKKLTAFFCITVMFSLCILGSTSYVKNTIIHCNPVYTMIGPDKSEIIDAESPIILKSLSHVERFLVSLSAISSNDKSVDEFEFKIPFTINLKEKYVYWPDVRMAGWGIFYSGILLVSLVCLILLWKKLNLLSKHCVIMLVLITFIPVFFVPGLFWARYWMILFLLPCLAMYSMSLDTKKRYITIFLLIMSVGNIVFPLVQTIENIQTSQKTKIEYLNLKEISDKNSLAIKLGADEFIFNGLVFNLKDYNISNYYLDNDLESNQYISAGQGRIFYEIME